MTTHLVTVATTLLFTVFLVSSAALAQSDEATLLRHGVQLRQQGRDDEALAEFERAYAISRGANAAGQMGLAEQALGRWLDAERHLREALAATDDRWVTRNRPVLQSAYAVIQQHVGKLEVLGGVAGAEVRINGEVVGTLPLTEPVRALAGTMTLEVRASGYYPESRRVEVPVGRVARESIDFRPISSASTPSAGAGGAASTRAAEPEHPRASGGLGGGPIALVVLGAALAIGAVAVSVGLGSTWAHESTPSDYNLWVPIDDFLYGAGGAALLAGVLWHLLSRGDRSRAAAAPDMSVAVLPLNGGATVYASVTLP